jgi:mannose-6-phosphate isomerase class I
MNPRFFEFPSTIFSRTFFEMDPNAEGEGECWFSSHHRFFSEDYA